VSYSEHAKATVKIVVTGPDGRVLKVVEGERPDPFDQQFLYYLLLGFYNMPTTEGIMDVNFGYNQAVYFPFYSSPVSSPAGSPVSNYVLLGPCLVNCPDVSPGPPNGPGIYIFCDNVKGLMPIQIVDGSKYYVTIAGLGTSSLEVGYEISPVGSPIISPASPDEALLYATGPVSITYTVSYKYIDTVSCNIYYVALVGALYLASPYLVNRTVALIPITYYVLPSPVGLSPGDVVTISVTLTFPNAMPAEVS
jgi:hypothetical protein